jgi:hypothetical protein
MTEGTPQAKYADKITKLLAKAESTTPEEAELLVAKAQELMMQYAITQAMIDEARGIDTDEIGQVDIYFVGIFQRSTMQIGFTLVNNNSCKCVYTNSEYYSPHEIDGKVYKQWHKITVTGFQSDLDRVQLLNASLQLQCSRAMQAWWKAEDRTVSCRTCGRRHSTWWSKAEAFKQRSSFIMGFAAALSTKLHDANEAGRKAAAQEAAVRNSTTEAEASDSVALVVRSRKDKVNDWYDKQYGKSLRSGRTGRRSVNHSAYGAGQAAGARANTGQSGVGGSGGAIGRG